MDLVVNNALLYNKSDSAIYRAASRLKKNVPPLYAALDKERVASPEGLPNGIEVPTHPKIKPETAVNTNMVDHAMEVEKASSPNDSPQPPSTIGDLEPPLDVLELLTSTATIKRDLSIDLQEEPLQSLLRYALAIPKPAPTPAPPPPPKTKKPKRDRKAEYERAKAKKAAAAAAAMATAAEALTLLNGGHHHDIPTVPQEIVQQAQAVSQEHPPLSPPSASPAPPAPTPAPAPAPAPPPPLYPHPPFTHELTFLNESPGFRMPGPEKVMVDTSSAIVDEGVVVETPTEMSPTSPKAERLPRRKRPSVTLPGRLEVPPVVSDVDNRDSFKMFDAGWILPPDHKRGGRLPPVDRSTQPPPRKRARTGTERVFLKMMICLI